MNILFIDDYTLRYKYKKERSMVVITQNTFLFFGIIVCLFLKRNLLINIIIRKNKDSNLNIKKEITTVIIYIYSWCYI